MRSLVWFRRDLRLADNPALDAAAARGTVLPVYIHDPEAAGPWRPGAASEWWLHHSLVALRDRLAELRLPLVIRRGPALAALQALVDETGAEAVRWNRLYDPALMARDRTIKAAMQDAGVEAVSHKAALLHEPWTIRSGQGTPYRAFTPFWRAAQRAGEPDPPLAVPTLQAPTTSTPGDTVEDLGLLPRVPWDDGLRRCWTPGETGARASLEHFVAHRLADYPESRERPADAGTSGLSAPLHFGEVSPRQIWAAVRASAHAEGPGAQTFLAEIGWREFGHHVLYHQPTLPDEPLDPRFAAFPWRADPEERLLQAWQAGRTGLPMVDAGMRELWATGWMHNRVRMITGSLLVKNLRLPWQQGEAWFWDTLVDADLANNSLGWQWVAGSGADAAPYFRIFNPVRQGERFDPGGEYVARWLPELAALAPRHRHAPWQAPAAALTDAGITLGRDYPHPVVDLKHSRTEALAAFQAIKQR